MSLFLSGNIGNCWMIDPYIMDDDIRTATINYLEDYYRAVNKLIFELTFETTPGEDSLSKDSVWNFFKKGSNSNITAINELNAKMEMALNLKKYEAAMDYIRDATPDGSGLYETSNTVPGSSSHWDLALYWDLALALGSSLPCQEHHLKAALQKQKVNPKKKKQKLKLNLKQRQQL